MIKFISAVLVFFVNLLVAQEPQPFSHYFHDRTMRIDYYHTGDAEGEWITIDQIYEQGPWAGSTENLIDPFNNGRYYIKIYDIASNRLIFSRGFDSYFGEYRTTNPALDGIKRTYHESAFIPYPKSEVMFVLEKRDRLNILHPLMQRKIRPDDLHIIKEEHNKTDKVIEILKNGHPHKKLDLVFVAEGYAAHDEGKFERDSKRCADVILSFEPFKSNKSKINISGVFRSSAESGVDQPRKGIFKNTVINSSFNALDLDRYLLTEDNKSLRYIASAVPHDAVVILVNSERYGGGGIYNTYAVSTVDNNRSDMVLIHEFGHSFAGLADEYYASEVAYNEFYPQGIEPTEPNITALLDPDNLKWGNMVSPDIDLPTDWDKNTLDSLNAASKKLYLEKSEKIKQCKSSNAPDDEIKNLTDAYDEKTGELKDEILRFKTDHPLRDKVGAFEGAGYSSTGLYRPMLNCLMISSPHNRFCLVCRKAIERMIHYYAE